MGDERIPEWSIGGDLPTYRRVSLAEGSDDLCLGVTGSFLRLRDTKTVDGVKTPGDGHGVSLSYAGCLRQGAGNDSHTFGVAYSWETERRSLGNLAHVRGRFGTLVDWFPDFDNSLEFELRNEVTIAVPLMQWTTPSATEVGQTIFWLDLGGFAGFAVGNIEGLDVGFVIGALVRLSVSWASRPLPPMPVVPNTDEY